MAALWRQEVMLNVRIDLVNAQDAVVAGLDFNRGGG